MTDKWTEMREELSKLTVRELRQIAREEGICLGYSASRKRAMLDEIVSERRYREIQGVTAVDLDGEVVS